MTTYKFPDRDPQEQLQRKVRSLEETVSRLASRVTSGVPILDDITYTSLKDDFPDGQLFILASSPSVLHWIANGTEYTITGTTT